MTTETVFRKEGYGSINTRHDASVGKVTVRRANGTTITVDQLLQQCDALDGALLVMAKENATLRAKLRLMSVASDPQEELVGDSTRFVPDPQRAMNERTQNAWKRDNAPAPKPAPSPKGAPPGWAPDPVAAMNERTQNAWKKPLLHSKVSGT